MKIPNSVRCLLPGFGVAVLALSFVGVGVSDTQAQTRKPNILVLWGDDIGTANVSAYSDGVMGYETPNIDRLAREGLRFLHYYGEQSCTAGRFPSARRPPQSRCSSCSPKVRRNDPSGPMKTKQERTEATEVAESFGSFISVNSVPSCSKPECTTHTAINKNWEPGDIEKGK